MGKDIDGAPSGDTGELARLRARLSELEAAARVKDEKHAAREAELVAHLAEEAARRKAAEQRIQDTRDFVHTILDTIPDPIFVKDEQHRWILINEAFCRFMKHPREALLGKSDYEFFPKEEADVFWRLDDMLFATGIPNENEESLTDTFGEVHVIATKKALCRDAAGNKILAGVIRDITLRVRAEESLRNAHQVLEERVRERTADLERANRDVAESEARFRATFEQAAVGIALVSKDDQGRFLRVNQRLCDIVGYTQEELLGRSFADITLPEDVEASFAMFEQVVADRSGTRSFDKRYRRKDGSIVWVHLTTTLAHDVGGRPPYLITVIEDISARKTAEEADLHSLSLVQATLDATADGILVTDSAGNIARYNRQLLQMWRVPDEVVATGSGADLVAFMISQLEEPSAFVSKVRELQTAADVESFDLLKLTDDRRFERYSKPQQIGDRDVGRVWSFRDVTERHRAEEALRRSEDQLRQAQKMEAVGRLAGGVAHDFNNLLTVIISCGGLAKKRLPIDGLLRKLIDDILESAQRAAWLTRQLLAFSRQQVLEPRVLDLNEIIQDATTLLARVIGEDVEIRTALAPRLWLARIDPGQLSQVLMNLAVNARDAMPEGGVLTIETANARLDVAAAERSGVPPGEYILCAVSDNGCGMDDSTQARLFEPFFTTKPVGKGTGLGLSTVYGIVQQSGGAITVYSQVGRGSSFEIYLPRTTPDAVEETEAAEEHEVARGMETVLLVDDDAAVRSVVHQMLEVNGYVVLAATTPEEAISIASTHAAPIHVVLTDAVMPRMNGRQVAERVLELHPEARVFFMSGYASDAVMDRGAPARGSVFIQKPFNELDLLRALREKSR